jgi:hypothetical protein
MDHDPRSSVRDWHRTSSFSPDNPLNHIVALRRAIVTPALSLLSITFVVDFRPKKERTVLWIR